MGELLLKDEEGEYKWISESGDPDELLSEKPIDPIRPQVPAEGWEQWENINGPNWVSPAHIPEEYYFDVPSLSGSYEIILDFVLDDTVVLQNIDPSNFTKRDILEKFVIHNFLGGGSPENILKVIPTVIYNGNSAPVADAGVDQTVYVNSEVILDGSRSYDPDNDPFTYYWAFESIPDGSEAFLSDPNSETPSFVPDIEGEYVISLVVNDGTLDSVPDTVIITVLSSQ